MHPTTPRRAVFSFAAHAALLCTALMIAFGPLNPPAGIVSSTAKPLSEVEPRIAISAVNTPGDADSLYKITAPGSYYLTASVSGAFGKHGIEIAVSNVTIDLNGFELLGTPGALDGVSTTVSNLSAITVKNGAIRFWSDGVDCSTSSITGGRFQDLTLSSNLGLGLRAGSFASLTNCVALANGASGLSAGTSCTLAGCVANDNGGTGIILSLNCSATACTAFANVSSGITSSGNSVLTGCTAASNTGNGFSGGSGTVITHCAASNNESNGFVIFSGGAVIGCTARANATGIFASGAALIRDNICSSNDPQGGYGISVGSDSRVEGNTCTASSRGLNVTGTGNLIVRNNCSGNPTNWVIAANNVIGPILDRTAPGNAAVNGNTAPDSTGSTHPNANFTN